MIKSLLIMRHGESEFNARRVYAGAQPHVQLTELGRQQARRAGHELLGRPIDLMVASNFDRAQETAKIAAGVIGYPASKIITDPRLHEIDVGTLTGQPDAGFVAGLAHISSGTDPSAETPQQVIARVTAFLRDLVAAADDKVALVVCHAGVCRVLHSLLDGVTLESIAGETIPNAEPFELSLRRINEVIA